jgi:hypothetical protein
MATIRGYAAVAAVSMLLITSGCLGILSGDQTFEATPATTDNATAEEHGYEFQGTERQEVTRQFSAGGQSRNVTAVNYITTYERTLPIGATDAKAGVFAVIATPQVEVLGETFNPVGDMDNAELVGLVQDNYESLSVDNDSETVREAEVLGESTNVSRFEGQARIAGQNVDVYVHITRVRDNGDFVVPVAIYPQDLPEMLGDQQAAVFDMLEAIEHQDE